MFGNGANQGRAALVIQSIVKEVVEACVEAGHSDVDEEVAAWAVKSVVLDPLTPFSDEMDLKKEDVGALVEASIIKLTTPNSMPIATAKMQLMFQRTYASFDEAKKMFLNARWTRFEDVQTKIVNTAPTSVQGDIEELYSKLVSSNLLRTNMGSPSEFTVIRETTAALESVLPPIELGVFMGLSRSDKERQLEELSMIVAGIRLFNKEIGKGGKEIPNLVENVAARISGMVKLIYEDLAKFCDLAEMCSMCQLTDPDNARDWLEAAINARQYQTYLTILHNDTLGLAERAVVFCDKFRARQSDVHNTIQSKTAVPTGDVYPLFIELADAYASLDICNYSLGGWVELYNRMAEVVQGQVKFMQDHTEGLQNAAANANSNGMRMQDDYVRACFEKSKRAIAALAPFSKSAVQIEGEPPAPKQSTSVLLNVDADGIALVNGSRGPLRVLLPGIAHGYHAIPLHLGGVCVFAASVSPPVLQSANRNIGILQYDEKYYGISSREAAVQFASDPDGCINMILENAKAHPELLELLQLYEFFESYAANSLSGIQLQKPLRKPHKCDSGTQSETHPVESNIVPHYDHSEWELRRKAIKLANLRTKKTHSVQTDRSHYKRETSTQVYLPKNNVTQTRRSTGTNVPKPATFIRGLRGPRGRKAQPSEVVDLTTGIGGIELSIKGLTGSTRSTR
eukprot:m.52127 g.52127  ORF g.52127 m.52127 type:complete len:683 (+) comp21546_c0_seq1:71-2119(+)